MQNYKVLRTFGSGMPDAVEGGTIELPQDIAGPLLDRGLLLAVSGAAPIKAEKVEAKELPKLDRAADLPNTKTTKKKKG